MTVSVLTVAEMRGHPRIRQASVLHIRSDPAAFLQSFKICSSTTPLLQVDKVHHRRGETSSLGRRSARGHQGEEWLKFKIGL
jgi:hypothetical protein